MNIDKEENAIGNVIRSHGSRVAARDHVDPATDRCPYTHL